MSDALRNRAEKLLSSLDNVPEQHFTNLTELLEELSIHQIELEMQNDELLKTRQELNDVSQRYHDLYQRLPVGYITIDKARKIIECNNAFCELVGSAPQAIINMPMSLYVHARDSVPFLEFLNGFNDISKKNQSSEVILRMRGSGNNPVYQKEPFWVKMVATLEEHDHRSSKNVLISVTDIDVNMNLDQELKDTSGKLQEEINLHQNTRRQREIAEKAAKQKSEFLAMVSHEMRTPLHAITNFSRMGLKYLQQPEKLQGSLENIVSATTRLQHLINNLLDSSKAESGKLAFEPQKLDMNELIRRMLEYEIAPLAIDITLDVRIDETSDFHCICDDLLVTRLMINLVANAVKFTSKGGKIEISGQILLGDLNGIEQPVMQVSVIDNGIGIPAGEEQYIFDRFTQSTLTQRHENGTGLGLHICRQIVDMHGGIIWAQSPPPDQNKGSVFTFQLPVAPHLYEH